LSFPHKIQALQCTFAARSLSQVKGTGNQTFKWLAIRQWRRIAAIQQTGKKKPGVGGRRAVYLRVGLTVKLGFKLITLDSHIGQISS